MTPRQLLAGLKQEPTDPVIAHEVGHTVVAHHQVSQLKKRQETCIVFRHRGNGIGAASHNEVKQCTAESLMCRHLAGIIAQSIFAPATVEKVFREQVLAGRLFEREVALDPGSEEAKAMDRHLSLSDWENALLEAGKLSQDRAHQLKKLRDANIETVELLQSERFNRICREMIADVQAWLDAEPDEPDMLAIYGEARIDAAFRKHPPEPTGGSPT